MQRNNYIICLLSNCFIMKFYLTFIFSLAIGILFAQKDTVRLREISRDAKAIVTDRPPQAIYFLLGGSGPLLSVNYDRRFQNRVNGAGFAVGLGFFGESGISIFSIPVSVNYLFGRNSHFLEIAGGATFISARSTDIFGGGSSGGSLVFFHVNAGYRYQPTKGGFFFRGGISPLFFDGEYVTSYYLGFGHNF
jgi:hypothetical protein